MSRLGSRALDCRPATTSVSCCTWPPPTSGPGSGSEQRRRVVSRSWPRCRGKVRFPLWAVSLQGDTTLLHVQPPAELSMDPGPTSGWSISLRTTASGGEAPLDPAECASRYLGWLASDLRTVYPTSNLRGGRAHPLQEVLRCGLSSLLGLRRCLEAEGDVILEIETLTPSFRVFS